MHDLIIVGAGTAGCVLAERLSSSGNFRVLLVEAGGKPSSPFVGIPAGFAKLFKSRLDWDFESEPQRSAGGRRIYIPRGKMLGGSSNMNAQIHQWCHPADFEEWSQAGASGWNWDDVRGVLKDHENLDGTCETPRGRAGRLKVSKNLNAHPMSSSFVESARKVIQSGSPEYNGVAYEGAWPCEVTCTNGRRFSAYDAWLKPAMGRANLEILTGASVNRITFDGNRATGVVIRRKSHERTYGASAGVVLAAGAFGTPKLLMLSGIGKGSALRAVGISTLVDSPDVGANLQDHPMVPLVFRTRRKDTLKNAESPASVLRYLVSKRGMLASNAVEAFAFARSDSDLGAPDVELIFAPFEWRREGLEPPKVHAFSIGAAVVAPESRGSVRLKSANPDDPASIDFAFLSDEGDRDRVALVEAVNLARRVASTDPLAGDAVSEMDPDTGLDGTRAFEMDLKTRLQTVYHPTSTCRMGIDNRAVVDPDLRVRGAASLWIADASVMPSVPRGHPNAVVAMIAERAAQFVERSLA